MSITNNNNIGLIGRCKFAPAPVRPFSTIRHEHQQSLTTWTIFYSTWIYPSNIGLPFIFFCFMPSVIQLAWLSRARNPAWEFSIGERGEGRGRQALSWRATGKGVLCYVHTRASGMSICTYITGWQQDHGPEFLFYFHLSFLCISGMYILSILHIQWRGNYVVPWHVEYSHTYTHISPSVVYTAIHLIHTL